MAPNNDNATLTQALLSRAHSPDSTNRIYSEKIQHRPLLLRPSSPPPFNARDARRKARKEKQQRAKALKPKPLSARERRRLGLYDIPREGQKYAIFEPLNKLWIGYMHEILGSEVYTGGQGAAAKLSAADFHGAYVEVARSGCPSRVGIRGIVVKDSRFTFEVITQQNKIKIVPKEGTIFRFHVPAQDDATESRTPFTFEIHGDQFQYRSADRANRKFKGHFLKNL
ncbi:ribonuclease P protein subunit p29 [Xylariomycetidae sp. FL0641]|nr:ribonuclease P protein subunit p29 [Xylariomycetidae sp. FL0641]